MALVRGRRRGSTRSTTSPSCVNLNALPTRFVSTWRKRSASPTRRSGTAGTACVTSSTCFWMTVARNVSVTSSSTSRRLNGASSSSQLVGLDLREVEDVVEDAEQVARRGMGDADVLMRLRREIGLERQPVHVDDRVHRRADLVAHHREERSLRPIRLHRLLTRRHEVAMRRLLRRHRVVDRAAELAQFAALVTEAGARLEVAGRHPARRGEDRADLAQEQRLADEPGDQEAEERRRSPEARGCGGARRSGRRDRAPARSRA